MTWFFFFLEKSFKVSFTSRKRCSIGSQEAVENKLILWKWHEQQQKVTLGPQLEEDKDMMQFCREMLDWEQLSR